MNISNCKARFTYHISTFMPIINVSLTSGGWRKETEEEEEEDKSGESKGSDGEKKSMNEKMQAM